LDKRLGGPHSQSGRGGEEKIPSPYRDSNPPFIQPAAQRYTTVKVTLSLCSVKHHTMKMYDSRDSSVGIALGYGLDDQGSRVRFPEISRLPLGFVMSTKI
jgi:hypothetical protein